MSDSGFLQPAREAQGALGVRSAAMATLSLGIFVTLVWQGARGIRGTDQYWYVTDLLMVRSGFGHVSNSVYPSVWLSDGPWTGSDLPPPIHNVPVTRLVSLASSLGVGEYGSWVWVNSLLAVASASLVYLISRQLLPPFPSLISACLFVLLPQTLWFSINALSEQFLVFAGLVVVWGAMAIRTHALLGLAAMVLGTTALALSRPSFLVILPAGIAYLFWQWRDHRVHWRAIVMFAACGAIFTFVGRALFPQYPSGGFSSVLRIGTPADVLGPSGVTTFYLGDDLPSIGDLMAKALANAAGALWPSGVQDLVIESLALALLMLGTFTARKSDACKAIIYWGWTFAGLYLATSVVFQAQPRYAATIAPIGLILSVAGVFRLRMVRIRPLVTTVSVTMMAITAVVASGALAWSYANEAQRHSGLLTTAAVSLQPATGEGTLAINLDASSQQQIAYLLAPAPVIFANPRGPAGCVPPDLMDRWQVGQVVYPSGLSLEQVQDAFCEPVRLAESFPAPFDAELPTREVSVLKLG